MSIEVGDKGYEVKIWIPVKKPLGVAMGEAFAEAAHVLQSTSDELVSWGMFSDKEMSMFEIPRYIRLGFRER